MQRLNPSTFCLLTFQSSPNLLAGCSHRNGCHDAIQVSILAQPLGWVQRLTCALWALFQSSLNLLAGCSWHFVIGLDQGCCSFNSHPTSRLGAGGGDHSPSLFQSSPNLLGWVQSPDSPVEQSLTFYCFNPHPISRSGAVFIVKSNQLLG